jgi:ankyrin repeat protein
MKNIDEVSGPNSDHEDLHLEDEEMEIEMVSTTPEKGHPRGNEENKLLLSEPTPNKDHFSQGIPSQSTQEFTFPKIVDVFAEVVGQNYLPVFKLLKHSQTDKSIDIFQQNERGFNLFHLIICTSNYPMVKIMLENFPNFAFQKSKSGQSNLMLAVNQKNFDIIRFIDERSHESYTALDSFGFDIFMYMVRNNSIVLFFYFLQRYLKHFSESSMKSQTNDSSDEMDSTEDMYGDAAYQQYNRDEFGQQFQEKGSLFAQSIFNLKVKDNNGCTLVHWAAFRDAEFLLKFFYRAGCDLTCKDFKGFIPIERAAENNAIKAVHFLNSYSKYPFQSYYFLFNRFSPVEFDFLPASYSKIQACYESDVLRTSFWLKRGLLGSLTIANLKYLYSKYNLKYKFGICLYIMWALISVLYLLRELEPVLPISATFAFVVLILLCTGFTGWFYGLAD